VTNDTESWFQSAAGVIDPLELSYVLHLLPIGRIAFRRWRYELWDGSELLAAGWRLSPAQAQRALRVHAMRYAHRRHGLLPLHPSPGTLSDTAWPGRRMALEWGELRVLLTPRTV
jgi:hypothetical protein